MALSVARHWKFGYFFPYPKAQKLKILWTENFQLNWKEETWNDSLSVDGATTIKHKTIDQIQLLFPIKFLIWHLMKDNWIKAGKSYEEVDKLNSIKTVRFKEKAIRFQISNNLFICKINLP